MRKKLMTEAETLAWEKEMREAGIEVGTPTASTITLLSKTNDERPADEREAERSE